MSQAVPVGRQSSLSITNGSLKALLETAGINSNRGQIIDQFKDGISDRKQAYKSDWRLSTALVSFVAFAAIGIGIFYVYTHGAHFKEVCIGGSVAGGAAAVGILFLYYANKNIAAYNAILQKALETFENQKAYLLPELQDLPDDGQCDGLLNAVRDEEFVYFVDKEVALDLDYPGAFKKVLSLSIDRLVRLKRVNIALRFMLNANLTVDECAKIISKLTPENYATFVKEFENMFFRNERALSIAAQNIFDGLIHAHLGFIDKKVKVAPLGLRFLENHTLTSEQIEKIIAVSLPDDRLQHLDFINAFFAGVNQKYFGNGGIKVNQASKLIHALCLLKDPIWANAAMDKLHIAFRFILILTSGELFGIRYTNEEGEAFIKAFPTFSPEVRQVFNQCLGLFRHKKGFNKKLEQELHIIAIWQPIFDGYFINRNSFSPEEWKSVLSALNFLGLIRSINESSVRMASVDQKKELVLFFFNLMNETQKKQFLDLKDQHGNLKLRQELCDLLFQSSLPKSLNIDLDTFLREIAIFNNLPNFHMFMARWFRGVRFAYSDRSQVPLEGAALIVAEYYDTKLDDAQRGEVYTYLVANQCEPKAICLKTHREKKHTKSAAPTS